jgi:hypothetical protein
MAIALLLPEAAKYFVYITGIIGKIIVCSQNSSPVAACSVSLATR